MAVATFNYTAWITRYPEFAGKVTEVLGALYFDEAGLYLDNTDCSPVTDINQRTMLLNMLVAHIAALNIARADPTFFAPGRINSATQGSVSVSLDLTALPGTAAWFAQTTYGLSEWAATAPYRTMHYFPGPERFLGVPFQPFGFGGPEWLG